MKMSMLFALVCLMSAGMVFGENLAHIEANQSVKATDERVYNQPDEMDEGANDVIDDFGGNREGDC